MCKQNEIEEMFKNLKDFSDEDLLREFENSSKLNIPNNISSPSTDEFDKIWERIQAEKAKFEQDANRSKKHRGPLKAVIQWIRRIFA